MNHQRIAIRHAVVQALLGGGTLAGANVFDSQYKPRVRFPALVVLVAGEDQRPLSGQGLGGFDDRAIERTLHLDVVAEVQQNTGAEDTRDNLLGQVEQLLASAAQAGALPGVKDLTPVAMRVEASSEGEKPIDASRQRFQITYFTTQADPGTAV